MKNLNYNINNFSIINIYKYKNLLTIIRLYCKTDFFIKNFYSKLILKKILFLSLKNLPKNLKDLFKLKLKKKSLNNYIENLNKKTKESIILKNFIIIKSNNFIKSYLYNNKILSIIFYDGVNNKNLIKDILLQTIWKKFKFLNLNSINYFLFNVYKNKFLKKNISNNLIYEKKFLNYIKKKIFLYQDFLKDKKNSIINLLKKYNIKINKIIILKCKKK